MNVNKLSTKHIFKLNTSLHNKQRSNLVSKTK